MEAETVPVRMSAYLIRPHAVRPDQPAEVTRFRKGMKAFDWRRRTCVQCGSRFGARRPRTFVAITFPDHDRDGIKSYGICRQCEKAPDYEIIRAATAYVQKLVGADSVSIVQ